MSCQASNCSESNNDFATQSTTLKLGECTISDVGPRVWNQLPTDLKAITDIRVFRRKFKTFVSIPVAHTNIILGDRSFVGGNIDSVLLYCIVLKISKYHTGIAEACNTSTDSSLVSMAGQ